jgi:hypothetical protein
MSNQFKREDLPVLKQCQEILENLNKKLLPSAEVFKEEIKTLEMPVLDKNAESLEVLSTETLNPLLKSSIEIVENTYSSVEKILKITGEV